MCCSHVWRISLKPVAFLSPHSVSFMPFCGKFTSKLPESSSSCPLVFGHFRFTCYCQLQEALEALGQDKDAVGVSFKDGGASCSVLCRKY